MESTRMNYRRGFIFGEHAAWRDKQAGKTRTPGPRARETEGGRGFWDGYTPRSEAWARVNPDRPAEQSGENG